LLGFNPPHIVIDPSLYDDGAAGRWSRSDKAIKFQWESVPVRLLAHELTHYLIDRDYRAKRTSSCCCGHHGDYFCEVERIVFEAIPEVLKTANV
jgi:hypothetical protein